MATKIKRSWPLKRYAEFTGIYNSHIYKKGNASCYQQKKENGWKQFVAEKGDLDLYYLEIEHVIIKKKNLILESFSVLTCSTDVNVVARGDSMLITLALKKEAKRFRIQFDSYKENSGVQQCEDCARLLIQFFPIKAPFFNKNNEASDANQPNPDDPSLEETAAASGETSASTIAQQLRNKEPLPLAYSRSNIPGDQLKDLIILCLMDSGFPAFVEEVDKVLSEIAEAERVVPEAEKRAEVEEKRAEVVVLEE